LPLVKVLHTDTSKIILAEMCLGRTTSQLHSKFVMDGGNVCMAKQTGVYLRNIADNFNDEIQCKHLLFSAISRRWLLLVANLSVKVHRYL
jgi:hypothetical protein